MNILCSLYFILILKVKYLLKIKKLINDIDIDWKQEIDFVVY